MNNFERIKNMGINEMAKFIICEDCFYCKAGDNCDIWNKEEEFYIDTTCIKCAKQWLESEVIE